MTIHDMTGDPHEEPHSSPEVESVEEAMHEASPLSRFSDDDLFDELARRHRNVILLVQRDAMHNARFLSRGDRYNLDGMVKDFKQGRKPQKTS